MKKVRLLHADEIECRVSSISERGIVLLLYKDARVDQNILDETYGVTGWQRTHERIGDSLFCTVSIYDEEKKEWISKSDVGMPTYVDSVKGEASDAFKRSCFNWSIGRELYTAPFIWIPSDKITLEEVKGKMTVKDRFHVSEIQYDEEKRSITGVEIKNEKDKVIYSHNLKKKELKKKSSSLSMDQRRALLKEMLRTGVTEESICERYKIDELKSMSQETYDRVMKALEKTADMAA